MPGEFGIRREQETASGLRIEFNPWDEKQYEKAQNKVDELDEGLEDAESAITESLVKAYGNEADIKNEYENWLAKKIEGDVNFNELSEGDREPVKELVFKLAGDSWRVFGFLNAAQSIEKCFPEEMIKNIEALISDIETLNFDGSLDNILITRLERLIKVRDAVRQIGGLGLDTFQERRIKDAIEHYKYNIKKEPRPREISRRYLWTLADQFKPNNIAVLQKFQEDYFGGSLEELAGAMREMEQGEGIEIYGFEDYKNRILPDVEDNNEAMKQISEMLFPEKILEKSVNSVKYQDKNRSIDYRSIQGNAAMTYARDERAIDVYPVGIESSMMAKSFIHEVGHSRSSGRFESVGEAISMALEWRQIVSEESVDVTPYVSKNYEAAKRGEMPLSKAVEEDWAESFAMYVLAPEYLNENAPRRFRIMDGFFKINMKDLNIEETRVNYRKIRTQMMGFGENEVPKVLFKMPPRVA